MMVSRHLDCLPRELLTRIVCCADAKSAMALARTCRTLYAACYDPLVFKTIVTESQRRWWHSVSLDVAGLIVQLGLDTNAWARFASADQRAQDMIIQLGVDASTWARFAVSDQRAREMIRSPLEPPSREDVDKWAPALILAKRKQIASLGYHVRQAVSTMSRILIENW